MCADHGRMNHIIFHVWRPKRRRGEGPYLTQNERTEVIRIIRKVAGGRCLTVAGVGGPGTLTAIAKAKAARDAEADALLVFPTPCARKGFAIASGCRSKRHLFATARARLS